MIYNTINNKYHIFLYNKQMECTHKCNKHKRMFSSFVLDTLTRDKCRSKVIMIPRGKFFFSSWMEETFFLGMEENIFSIFLNPSPENYSFIRHQLLATPWLITVHAQFLGPYLYRV